MGALYKPKYKAADGTVKEAPPKHGEPWKLVHYSSAGTRLEAWSFGAEQC